MWNNCGEEDKVINHLGGFHHDGTMCTGRFSERWAFAIDYGVAELLPNVMF